MLVLTDEQALNVERMATTPSHAALVAGDTGIGKTLLAVELARRLNARTVLVIAPLGTFGGWVKTVESQQIGLDVYQITPKTAENYTRLAEGKPGVYLVGREFFHLSATSSEPHPETGKVAREARWSWARTPVDLVVADEIQFASNRDSNAHKVLKTLKAGFRLGMSATPQGNKFKGLWAVCYWLWPKETNHLGEPVADRSFWRWAKRWANVEDQQVARNKTVKVVTAEQNPGAYVSTLPCYVRMEAVRVPVDKRIVKVDLSEAQRKMYTEMAEDMLTWLEEHPLETDISIVQRLRLRQITLGEVSFNEEGAVDFALDCQSSKIDALERIVADHPGEPILVLVESAKFVKSVVHRLGPTAREWSGRISQRDRETVKAAFGGEVQYLVATIASIAEGVDGLQRVCSTEVWLSEHANSMLNLQAQGRLNRTGQKERVITSYYVLAENTDDDGEFERQMRNRIDQREVLTV